jgi:hypothetical protein
MPNTALFILFTDKEIHYCRGDVYLENTKSVTDCINERFLTSPKNTYTRRINK